MQTKAVPYTFTKRGYFYFTRRIPNDLVVHYDTDRIIVGLRTKSSSIARTRAMITAAKLEEYWHGLRSANADLPGKHRLRERLSGRGSEGSFVRPDPDKDYGPMLSDAMELYFKQRGQGKSKVFFNVKRRACAYLLDAAGDKPLGQYKRLDAISFRDAVQSRGFAGTSVGRLLNCISAIFNHAVQELALGSRPIDFRLLA